MNTRRGNVRRPVAGACVAAMAYLALAGPTFADDKKITSTQLFDDATALVKLGNYVTACPKFEESLRLDFQIGTLYWLADCQEHVNKLASAWANFVDAAEKATIANKPTHAKEARGRADALKGRLNKMILVVSEELTKTPGLEVRRDGTVMGAAQFGVAVPIDNGKHEIKVSASAKRSWQTSVEVTGEGNTLTVTIPTLKEEPDLGPTAPAQPPPQPDATSTSARATAGLIIGGAGILGLGVGTALALVSKSTYDGATNHCSAQNQCDAEGLASRRDALTLADAATVTFAVGGALLAGGAVLWLTAPSKPASPKSSAAVVVGPASLSVVGSF